MFQTKFAEKIETRIFIQYIHFLENSAVYDIMCINTAEPGRPQMTKWRTRIACWIHKVSNTLKEYVILIAFPLQQWITNVPHCYVTHTLPVLLVTKSMFKEICHSPENTLLV
jgi:hypothetical protein